MSIKDQEYTILCKDHPNQIITHVNINNNSTQKLLCSKCMKNNRLIEECDFVSFQKFTESMKAIQNQFQTIGRSQLSEEEIIKIFNGNHSEDKMNKISIESSKLSNQYRVLIFSQIQESCDLFIKHLQENILKFKQEMQEALKSVLTNSTKVKQNSTEQIKSAGIILKSLEEKKQYQELDELIKQLHQGKLEIKCVHENLNSIKAQVKETLQNFFESQNQAFEQKKKSLNSLILPQNEGNYINSFEKKSSNQQGNSLSCSTLSPLKSKRLQLSKQDSLFIKHLGSVKNQKSIEQNQSIQNTSISSGHNLSNQSNSPQKEKRKIFIDTNSKRAFFKDRFAKSLYQINDSQDKSSSNYLNTSPSEIELIQDEGNLNKTNFKKDSLSEIKNITTENTSTGEINDCKLTNYSQSKTMTDNKINKEEKRALIDSLYYKNNNKNHDDLVFKPRNNGKQKLPNQNNLQGILQQKMHHSNTSLTYLDNLKTHSVFRLQSQEIQSSILYSSKKLQGDIQNSLIQSPDNCITISKTKDNKEDITHAIQINKQCLISGTSDGYLLVYDISASQKNSNNMSEIKLKMKVKAHKSVNYLSRCPCNSSMFFSVGKLRDNISSIKIWSIANNLNLTEITEIRDSHPLLIDEIHVLKEEMMKDQQLNENNLKEKQNGEKQKDKIQQKQQPQSLLTVITLLTLSKSDSLKVWKVSHKNGCFQNGTVSKQVEVSLKNQNIKSGLHIIGHQFYLSNENTIFCYILNQEYSSIINMKKIDLFAQQNDFISQICVTNELIGVMSKNSQLIILSNELEQKYSILNFIKQLSMQNKNLDWEKISISHLIPLQNNHFGIGFHYEEQHQQVAIFSGQTCKSKQIIDQFDSFLSFVLGKSEDFNIILFENNGAIKIQQPWIDQQKKNITFQKLQN